MAFKKQKMWSDSAYNDRHLLIPGWISWRKWMSGLLNMYCTNADVHKTDKSNIAVVLQKCRMPTFSSSDGAAHAADLPPGVPLQRHLNCLTMSGERGLLLRESCTKRRQISSLPRIKRRRAAAESKHELPRAVYWWGTVGFLSIAVQGFPHRNLFCAIWGDRHVK